MARFAQNFSGELAVQTIVAKLKDAVRATKATERPSRAIPAASTNIMSGSKT
jgi:hypothetical protein